MKRPRPSPFSECLMQLAYAALLLAVMMLSASALRSSGAAWTAPENLFRLLLAGLSAAGAVAFMSRIR